MKPYQRCHTPSPNHGERRHGGDIDMLVFHYTGMQSAALALARLTDPKAEVSAHYLIEEDGKIHCLVPEERRAWHAGLAYWRGIRDVNSHSIGIEIVNPGHEFGYVPFPQSQIQSVILLSQDICARHPIPHWGIVGHSDIAPDRKQDPGELFPWQALAREGIGIFPTRSQNADQIQKNDSGLKDLLVKIGYDPESHSRIEAFQRRFRPALINNIADQDCLNLAASYLSSIDRI